MSNEPEDPGPTPDELAMLRADAQRDDLKKYQDALNTAVAALSGDVTDADINFANTAIGNLEMAIGDAADVSADELASYRSAVSGAKDSVAAANDRLTAAKEKAQDMADKERMAMARKLYNALNPNATAAGNMALMDEIVTGRTGGLVVGADGNLDAAADMNAVANDSPDAIEIKASGTTVADNAGWKGADYMSKIDGVTHHVVMYNNRGSGSEPFNKKHGSRLAAVGTGVPPASYQITEDGPSSNGLDAGKEFVMGGDFSDRGTKSHTDGSSDDNGKKVTVSGTFDGVSGTYSCTQSGGNACTSMVDVMDHIVLDGGWTFVPSSLMAPISKMDGQYLSYGWWTRETSDGVVDVRPFANSQGAVAVQSGNAVANTINGKASYMGGAAGKYAVYNPLGDNSSAGAFTAKATLEANFTTDKISGKLTDFMSGGESMDWEVSLNVGDMANITDNGIGQAADNDAAASSTTTWMMGETASDAKGSWDGHFYKSNDAAADAEANRAPAVVTGTFNAMYDVGGLNIGQMAGAFGADLDE